MTNERGVSTPFHFLDESHEDRIIVPTKYKRDPCRISDDSNDPIGDALENQIPYTWCEDDLRERACAFANLAGKNNTGSQTIDRTFRRPIATQVYVPHHHTCDTLKPKSTQTSKIHYYVFYMYCYCMKMETFFSNFRI